MVWKECDRVSSRREFVALAKSKKVNLTKLCKRFGVSRKTGYKWLKRFDEEGAVGLKDRSTRPHDSPSRTAEAIEAQVLEVRDQHPAWGGRKIRRRLLDLNLPDVPAASTITKILKRNGRISDDVSAEHQPAKRFEREQPNELWQMDFKGEFRMNNQQWCHPLTVLDDHSRFSLVLEACGDQKGQTVQRHLTAAFRRYGLPAALLTDNGTPWGVPHSRGAHTKLTVWLLDQDIRVLHGRPYHPQTQGKEERFHRTLKTEVLQGRQFDDLRHTQQKFDPWRAIYNEQRPHEALGLDVPARHYQVSAREYQERPRRFEYDSSFDTRKVDAEGRVRFRGRYHNLGRGFARRQVGVRSTANDGIWTIYYRTFPVLKIDLREGD